MTSPAIASPLWPPARFMGVRDGELLGLARLARMAFRGADLSPVKTRLLERLASNDNDANALMDLSIVMQLMGQRDLGLSMLALALGIRRTYRLTGTGEGPGLRLLVILSPGDLAENNALEFLTEGSDVTLELIYLSPSLPLPAEVPDHDAAMIAVCESDRNRPLLEWLSALVKGWPRPLVCAPERIARLSRDGTSELLQTRPGIVVPVTRRVSRELLDAIGHGVVPVEACLPDGGFPVIVRPVDSQKGHGLVRAGEPAALLDYLAARPEQEFYMARYVEYRSPDGLFRKYRVVLIDGRPYVCHMAVSQKWVVHYMSAGMVESASKRDEEAHCFSTFDDGFALRHQAALRHIAESVELEYVGIDCGETPDGELLVFEVDSGMTVHAMDPVELFPYKQPQMHKVFRAFRQMLADAAAAGRPLPVA